MRDAILSSFLARAIARSIPPEIRQSYNLRALEREFKQKLSELQRSAEVHTSDILQGIGTFGLYTIAKGLRRVWVFTFEAPLREFIYHVQSAYLYAEFQRHKDLLFESYRNSITSHPFLSLETKEKLLKELSKRKDLKDQIDVRTLLRGEDLERYKREVQEGKERLINEFLPLEVLKKEKPELYSLLQSFLSPSSEDFIISSSANYKKLYEELLRKVVSISQTLEREKGQTFQRFRTSLDLHPSLSPRTKQAILSGILDKLEKGEIKPSDKVLDVRSLLPKEYLSLYEEEVLRGKKTILDAFEVKEEVQKSLLVLNEEDYLVGINYYERYDRLIQKARYGERYYQNQKALHGSKYQKALPSPKRDAKDLIPSDVVLTEEMERNFRKEFEKLRELLDAQDEEEFKKKLNEFLRENPEYRDAVAEVLSEEQESSPYLEERKRER